MALRIVTDSTCDLPADLAASLNITIVPLSVIFGEESFLDGIDITPAAFVEKLTTTKALPHTAQPSPAAFTEVYQHLLAEGHDIVSIHISTKLSGTLQSARLGGESLDAGRITYIDSAWTSMGLGLMVLEAAHAAVEGATASDIVRLTDDLRGKIGLLLFCDTLEFLQRGGRIGKASAFLGGLLQVKPIITLRNGEVAPYERVRTRSRALERLWEWLIAYESPRAVCPLYTGDSRDAEELLRRSKDRFPNAHMLLVPVGSVIATHVGPGAVGVAVLP